VYQILSDLLALVRTRSRHRSAPRSRAGGTRLRLEAMEERLALSTTAIPTLTPPLNSPAHTAPLQGPTGTSGEQSAADPEQVCGYKHRGPCRPHAFLNQLPPPLAVHGQLPQVVQASPLVAGGSDGPTVSISGAGHTLVRAPEGPLPVDLAFAAK